MAGKFRRRGNESVLRDYGITIGVAMLFALLVRFFAIEAYRIPTSAMRPTLESGDTIFVGKWHFGLRMPLFLSRLTSGRLPERGEVVLYSPPDDAKRDILKRVVGLAGERVEIRQGRVSINGKPFAVDLPKNSSCGTEAIPEGRKYGVCWEPPALEDFGPTVIPADSVFAISDLRSGSGFETQKSRAYGVVPVSAVRGKALWVWLSIEPRNEGHTGWFPQFRFERMFRRIE